LSGTTNFSINAISKITLFYKLAVVDKFYNPLAQRSDVTLATEK